MPFIHIKSLPFTRSLNMAAVLEGISHDFSKETETDLKHVHATWQFFEPGHYAVNGEVHADQAKSSHPVLVDLLTPDFDDEERIETMLTSLAASIAKRANINKKNIFINHRYAHSGMVFDNGRVERW